MLARGGQAPTQNYVAYFVEKHERGCTITKRLTGINLLFPMQSDREFTSE